eukprot:evm.model.scf_598EXC.2 EVM.evm.TU.scf_598EXC.2   scf_598EXC:19021-20227(-)
MDGKGNPGYYPPPTAPGAPQAPGGDPHGQDAPGIVEGVVVTPPVAPNQPVVPAPGAPYPTHVQSPATIHQHTHVNVVAPSPKGEGGTAASAAASASAAVVVNEVHVDSCCNIYWVLFGLSFIFAPLSICGTIGLCAGRTQSEKQAGVANLVLLIIWVIAIIILSSA